MKKYIAESSSKLLKKIARDVESGKVKRRFRVKDFSFLSKSPSFISKHAIGNGRYAEYFRRIKRGLYELK